MKWARAIVVLCGVAILAAIVMGIIGIWTGDVRWGDTAMLIGFPAAIIGVILGLPFIARLDEL